MKALKITLTHKTLNPNVLTKDIGEIQIFTNAQIPKVWRTETATLEYFHKQPEKQKEVGFYDVIEPTFNETTQYLDSASLYLNETDTSNPFYTYLVKDYTQAELYTKAQELVDSMPLLIETYANAIGVSASRGIDIPVDQIEIFNPKEKVYSLLGQPLYKEYYKDDVCVCRLEYEKMYEDRIHQGITKNEFVATCTRFIFYKDEARQYFTEKLKVTKRFEIVPTTITDETDTVIDVIWSSADRETLLRNQRYKSEQVMRAFNPALYQLFISIWGELYLAYKETGNNTAIVSAVNDFPNNNTVNLSTPEENAIVARLDSEVLDDDKAIVFGDVAQYGGTYPSLTVRQLIIQALPSYV